MVSRWELLSLWSPVSLLPNMTGESLLPCHWTLIWIWLKITTNLSRLPWINCSTRISDHRRDQFVLQVTFYCVLRDMCIPGAAVIMTCKDHCEQVYWSVEPSLLLNRPSFFLIFCVLFFQSVVLFLCRRWERHFGRPASRAWLRQQHHWTPFRRPLNSNRNSHLVIYYEFFALDNYLSRQSFFQPRIEPVFWKF